MRFISTPSRIDTDPTVAQITIDVDRAFPHYVIPKEEMVGVATVLVASAPSRTSVLALPA